MVGSYFEAYKQNSEEILDCKISYWLEGDLPKKVRKFAGKLNSIELNRTAKKTEILVPLGLKNQLYCFLFSFGSIEKEIDVRFLGQLEQVSRALISFLSNEKRQFMEFYFRNLSETLANDSEKGIILFDAENRVIYENDISKNNDLINRFNNYKAQSDDKRIDNSQSCSFVIEDSNPVLITLNNIYFSNQYLGKQIFSETLSKAVPKGQIHSFELNNRSFTGIIGKNSKLLKNIDIAKKVAITDSTVLLRGESGTGKERFASAIHEVSHRRKRPFIAINCAAIPEHLLESELFGYEPGSFTGASKTGKMGKVEAAHTGTIFLDEIGDMSPALQAKLLRLLQNMQFERIGSTTSVSVDVRFITATHRNLEEAIQKGLFRQDLFFRINVIPIYIPPLRERRDDIEYLLNHFIKKYAILSKTGYKTFTYDAFQIIKAAPWAGNIRELENMVEYCMTVSDSDRITPDDLPMTVMQPASGLSTEQGVERMVSNKKISRAELSQLLSKFGYSTPDKKKLSKHLNVSLATLYRWLKKYDL